MPRWWMVYRKADLFAKKARLKSGSSSLPLGTNSPEFWRLWRLERPTWLLTAYLSKAQKRSRRERMRLERQLLGKQFPQVLQEASKPPRGRDPQTMGLAVRRALRKLKG